MPMLSVISSRERMLGSGALRSPGISTPESAAASGMTSRKMSKVLNIHTFPATERRQNPAPAARAFGRNGELLNFPLLSEEGWLRDQEKVAQHRQTRSRGGDQPQRIFVGIG